MTLVGCGGGGGGGGGDQSGSQGTQSQQSTQGNEGEGENDFAVQTEGEGADPLLLGPVDDGDGQFALLSTNNDPGYLAANPEPTTAVLGALGLAALLTTRRWGRRA